MHYSECVLHHFTKTDRQQLYDGANSGLWILQSRAINLAAVEAQAIMATIKSVAVSTLVVLTAINLVAVNALVELGAPSIPALVVSSGGKCDWIFQETTRPAEAYLAEMDADMCPTKIMRP